jgi:hypothetical protein
MQRRIALLLVGLATAGCSKESTEGTADAAAGGDAMAGANIDLECDARSETTCASDGRCHPIFGNTEANFCSQIAGMAMYAGCTPAGRLNNTAFTWATDPRTGRTLVFGNTEVPYGWIAFPLTV